MHFLQSREWEELQKEMGRKAWRVKDVLAIQHTLPFGKNYVYVGGALFDAKALEEIKKIAREEGAMFLKWEPMTPHGAWSMEHGASNGGDQTSRGRSDPLFAHSDQEEQLTRAGFRKAFKVLQPQRTIIMDLTKSEEDLLAFMHPKARYNIGVAKRHGMKVRAIAGAHGEEMNALIRLLHDTAQRDGFHGHPVAYYKKLATLPSCELFVAEHEGRMAAAALVLFFEGTATYLHGASDYALRQLMAPHLLHWEIMREAKKRGCAQYDLWGIDERKWPGVTRFKRGFGGKEILHIGSWDFVFQPFFYALYALWARCRK